MTTANKSKIPSIRPVSMGARGTLPERAMSSATRTTATTATTTTTTTPTGISRLPRRPQSDKPLPSPPVAQLVDPNSPPKVSRTLVDAFTPSPTLKEWPVMHPENIPPRLSSKRSSLPTRGPTASRSQTSFNGDEGTRVKRLSWHSSASGSSSGTGPILTISGDADAMILGQRDSIPAVPAIPLVLPERTTPLRSFGALTGCITKGTTSRADLSIKTALPGPGMKELAANGNPVVKISPIRSMQPPRQPSLESPSPKSPSSVYSTFPDRVTISETSLMTLAAERNVSPISDRSATPTPEPKPPAPPLREAPKPPLSSAKAHEELPEEASEPMIALDPDEFLSVRKVRKTASALENVCPSLSSTNRPSNNNDSTPNISTTELSSLSLPQAKHSRDMVRTQDPSKVRVVETARSISIDSPLGRGTPKSRPSRRQPYTPVVSSSPAEDTPPPENQDKATIATKAKANRSIRSIFSREKTHAKSPEMAAAKQGFMSATRSSLAKVMRDSKNLSRVHLPRKSESRSEISSDQVVDKKISQPGMFAAFSNNKATSAQEIMPGRRSHANEMLQHMVDRIEAQPEDPAERLRHVQIAECIVLAAEYSRNANISALEAKKNARDAELHADRAALEFTRLNRLLEGAEIDVHSVRFLKSLLTSPDRVGMGEETRREISSGRRTAH